MTNLLPSWLFAGPEDDELAGGVGGDGRTSLLVRRICVDARLGAEERAGIGVVLAKDSGARAVLPVALPDQDEIAGESAAMEARSVDCPMGLVFGIWPVGTGWTPLRVTAAR